jgi:hypothetical protein
MIDKLLELADGRFVVPLIVAAMGIALTRGAFTLARSKSQDRRDFLDLFRNHAAQSDLWIAVSVRHVFGAYLPPALIRQLMSSPQPGRALLEVAAAWDFIDMDDETGELSWRRSWFHTAMTRKIVVRTLAFLYFLLGIAALSLAYLSVTGAFDGKQLWLAWTYTVLSAFGAFWCLSYSDTLRDADRAARRWLGMA